MGDDDEKVNLIGDLNSALASQWVCSVRRTFWEEGCFFRKKEMWGKQKKVHEIRNRLKESIVSSSRLKESIVSSRKKCFFACTSFQK
jgi:hypothetical protein